MTYLEKLKQDHPNWDDEEIRRYIEDECPQPYKSPAGCPDGLKPLIDCKECWNREIPETENNEREETKMETTATTRKTKAELLQDIAELKKEVEKLDRYKKYEEAANEIAAMCESFVTAGFTREEAFKMTTVMIQTASKMPRI